MDDDEQRVNILGSQLLMIATHLATWRPEDKIIVLIHSPDEENGSITAGGYEDNSEIVHDMTIHMRHMMEQAGGRIVVMPLRDDDPEAN